MADEETISETIVAPKPKKAAAKRAKRTKEAVVYERYEDDPKNVNTDPEGFKPAKVTAQEVPLEDSRKDKTTVLATDRVSLNADGDLLVEKQ